MKPRIGACNITVGDLGRSRRFYEGMGFPAHPKSNDRAVFFELDGSWLSIFTKDYLAELAGTPTEPPGPAGVCFSHVVLEIDEVDAILAKAVSLGGSVVVQPKTTESGRGGYFADPDGYRWEVAYSPAWKMLAG